MYSSTHVSDLIASHIQHLHVTLVVSYNVTGNALQVCTRGGESFSSFYNNPVVTTHNYLVYWVDAK